MTEQEFRKAVEDNVAHRSRLFADAGFVPIDRVLAERRTVRRLMLGIFIPHSIPAVEVERLRDGRTVMRLSWRGQTPREMPAPAGLWEKLTALDAAVFAAPRFDAPRLNRPPVGSSCHGDQIDVERTRRGKTLSAGGNQCSVPLEVVRPPLEAALAVYADALLQTKPGCRDLPRAHPTHALEQCFPPR